MAERSTSGKDDRSLPDGQNFEHGVVNSDAVYVPHSKQSLRGRRGRGKSSGNYRHGQQQNDNLDRSMSDGSKQFGARGKYSGGRGQRPWQRNQYFGRRDVRDAAYESRQLPESGEALFRDSSYYSESNVADTNASFCASADTYNGANHTHFYETEFNAPFFPVQEHVVNSGVPRKARDDHRYEESQRRGVDQQRSRRGRHAYSRGRGRRGASNYFSDEKFVTGNTLDGSVQSNGTAEAGFEASNKADFCRTAEFANGDRKHFGSKAQFSRKLKSDNEQFTLRDDKHAFHGLAAASRDTNCISDDLQFHDLHISNPRNVHNEADSQAVLSVRIKSSDPEFESQRGNCSCLITSYVFVIVVSIS